MRCYTSSSLFLIVFVLLVGAARAAQDVSLGPYQRLWISCDTKAKLDVVTSHVHDEDFDFLRIPRALDEPVYLLVAESRLDEFKDELRKNDIEFEVIEEDANRVDGDETRHERRKRSANVYRFLNFDLDFRSYPRYEEIQAYLQVITAKYAHVSYQVLGYSFENREIMGIKFSSGRGSDRKPAVLIDAGIHAREWIAPTTALYAIKQLAENASNYHLFQDIDIYIVPLVNPDGYEYAHINQSTRYWRKTRSIYNFTECRGADANRNFDVAWGTIGTSELPCQGTFAGNRPFSESETRAIRDFILARRDQIQVYLTLHSFGQYMLHPWGYKKELPPNEAILNCTANEALKELTKVRGTVYKVGSPANLLYVASGGSDDWAMEVAGVPIVFTMELPPAPVRNTLEHFHPSVREILPVGIESFEAFKVFFRYANGEVCHSPRQIPAALSKGVVSVRDVADVSSSFMFPSW